MKILVTGVAGFIGSKLAYELKKEGVDDVEKYFKNISVLSLVYK